MIPNRLRDAAIAIAGLVAIATPPGASPARAQDVAAKRPAPPPEGLRRAIAEADRLDPGWRIADLEARRVRPPAGKNSADLLGGPAARIVAMTEAEREALAAAIDPAGGPRLDATAKASLRGLVDRNRAAVATLRGLVDRPTGRFSYQVARNPLETLLPHLQPLRDQVRLLLADAVLRLDGGDADGALASCRAAFLATRSVADEPFAISQLVRVSCLAQAQEAILAVLARGRPTATALGEAQRLVAEEAASPIALVALRGERALMFELVGHLADGRLTLDDLSGRGDSAKRPPADPARKAALSAVFRTSQGLVLERRTRLVELVRTQPPSTWHEAIDRFDRSIRAAPKPDPKRNPEEVVPQLLLPAAAPVIRGELRADALSQALVLLIAAARDEQARGTWPPSAAALVPGQIAAVPTDPMTGKPMKMVRKGDRLIAYSLGIDGRDGGGAVAGSSRQAAEKSEDVGFELKVGRAR